MPHSKKPSETLTKEVFFLIRRIFPVSNNSPPPPQRSTAMFPPCMHASSHFADSGRLERWKAGRGEKAMGGEGGSRVHMAGKNYTLFLFFGGGGDVEHS